MSYDKGTQWSGEPLPGAGWTSAAEGVPSEEAELASTRDEHARFEDSLELIDTILERICARYKVHGEEQEDFSSWALLRLWEKRSSIWEGFEHKASFSTYLDTVVSNLLRDYRISKWGKWRPSAKARQLGPTAVELEAYLYRDRLAARDAIEIMTRTNSPYAPARRELWEIVAQLPVRVERRPSMDSSLLEDVVADRRAVRAFDAAQDAAFGAEVADAMTVALRRLKPNQRDLLRERYLEQRKVVDIAARVGREPTPLYAQLSRSLKALRRHVEEQGVPGDAVAAYLDRRSWHHTFEAGFEDVAAMA